MARSFAAVGEAPGLASCLIVAAGVPDSRTQDRAAFDRELATLDAAIQRAIADGWRVVLFSGGGAIYGTASTIRREDDELHPVTPYGRHQATCEDRIRASGVRHLICRLPNLVGARQHPAQLVPALVRQVLDGTVTVWADASRDLLDADEMARLVTAIVPVCEPATTVNIASGISMPVRDIVDRIQAILGTTAAIRTVPGGDAQRFSIDRMTRLLRLAAPGDAAMPSDAATVLRRHVPALAGHLAGPSADAGPA